MAYMTNEEADEYLHLLERKKKALSLESKEREKFKEEWEKILDGTTDKILDYVYCIIGPYELENAPSKTVAALLDMPSLWGDLKKYEEQGEAKKIKGIAEALKIMYQTLKDVGYGEEQRSETDV